MSFKDSPLAAGLLEDLARKLEEEAESRGSQTELAEQLGIVRSHMLKIIKTKKADFATIVELAERLGIVVEHDGFVIGPISQSGSNRGRRNRIPSATIRILRS
ncbi:MAG TPA: hypothetical protein VGK48_06510 [Terriglobia bacterium]|jgi:hypothetical protein